MKRIATLVLALLLSAVGFAQDKNQEIKSLLDEMISDKSVVGVVAGYTVNGETIGKAALGHADLKAERKFELDTRLRMGSIAKSMTALAVMQLVEKGLIDLDAPVQTYIPEYPKQANTQITSRHLLSHTSGISGYKDGRESNTTVDYPTLTDALSLFKDRELLFEPGTQYSYTTYGYTVLGVVIERVSKETFESYMQTNIWDKAAMTSTGVVKYGVRNAADSQLYSRQNGKGKAKAAKENNLSNRLPAGGFYTTVGDMLKFGNAVVDNILVKEETLSVMREHHSLEKENNGYGFGWFLYGKMPNEGEVIGHTGAQTGNTSFLFIVPERKVVSVILANTSRAQSRIDPVAVQLLNMAVVYAKEQ